MRKLYKFYWDCGRQGELQGIFVCDDAVLIQNTDKNIYFGEVLGKHSEIYGVLNTEDVEILTDDQDFIDKAIEYGLVPCGYNPLDYIAEDDEGKEE